MTRPLALVTGASGGIGEAFARELAGRGYDLVLAARSADKLQSLAEELRGQGAGAHVFPADLGAADGPKTLIDAVHGAGLTVDLLVNNAGFGDLEPFDRADPGKLTDMINLNVRALTALSHAVTPGLVARGHGGIINIASTAAFLPGPGMATYYATKAFVLSLSEALHVEMKPKGVTVTAVCPGPTWSGFQEKADMEGSKLLKASRMMTPKDVARIGMDGFERKKRVVVTGVSNKITIAIAKLTPKTLLMKAVSGLQEKP
ncbi:MULTISPECIES: SDR family NAD(P)-dependent oxidoreductase [Hyphobacterium]|uniref:SDR family NAD(P)-dependent oxidoreductase n=1 Tax=Hyphobacterium vulgare TaxID=1736751 RepID=A0ABV6ZY10_9PROT